MSSRAGSPAFSRKLGARIRSLREGADLTQEKVAWACDIPKAHLSRIEHGKRLPSLPVLIAIAKELEVDVIDLLAINVRDPRAALLDAIRNHDELGVRTAIKRLGM